MKKIFAGIAAVLSALALIGCGGADSAAKDKSGPTVTPTPITLENYSGDRPAVEIVIRDYGTIKAELYPDIAPISVKNFLDLVDRHFYDGLTFHRIIDGFMMQGGAPNSESPAVTPIKGEFSSNGIENTISHVRGILSMARTPDPDSATSQFFIVQGNPTYLDGAYAGFGKVLSGMDVVDAICKAVPVEDDNGTVLPENQPVIETIRRAA